MVTNAQRQKVEVRLADLSPASTVSAEAMWLAGATDTLEWVCLFWAWVTDSNCERRLGDKTVRRLPKAFSTVRDDALNDPNESTCQTKELIGRIGPKEAFLATDCKSLFD